MVAMMLALTAGPAFTYGAAPNGQNCLGNQQSGAVAGPDGNTGSPVNPVTNDRGSTWNGPYTSYYAQQPGSSVGLPGSSDYPNGPSGYQAGYHAPTYAACG